MATTAFAIANPVDGVVSAGSAAITATDKTVTVQQTSDKAVIDWRKFNIASDETTTFQQPNANSVTLNRVNDSNASVIDGTLKANGNIVLINPNGILFGKNAKVDVAGITATTANISNADFMAGKNNFSTKGSSDATISNQGSITVREAGLVNLVAPNVENTGVINAKLGKVHLAGGDTFTVDLAGDGLLDVALDPSRTKAVQVTNAGTISAEGGTVRLTAGQARSLIDNLIVNSGEIEATSLQDHAGSIVATAQRFENSGTMAATGGSLAVSAQTVVQNGSLLADGGKISIATGQYSDSAASLMRAKGGAISVLGDNGSTLDAAGTWDVSADFGGTINLSADAVRLHGAHMNADGTFGGGTILTGGDYQGGGYLRHALHVDVDDTTLLSANALTSGNGGKVVLWSDLSTVFSGVISAHGGALGGNGGTIETSSKKYLSAVGTVNASAPKGQAGNWLLDPTDITINTSATAGGTWGGSSFTPTAATGNILVGSITTALNAGTSVTISTNSAYGGSGDITVATAIAKTAGAAATLTLQADRNIIVNSAISSTTGALGVVLDANRGGSGGYVDVTAAITTLGGALTIGGGATPTTMPAVGLAGHTSGVNITAALNTGAGNVIINGTAYNGATNNNYGINLTNTITTTTGSITLVGIGNGSGTGESGINFNGGALASSGGNISVSGTATSVAGGAGSGILLVGTGKSITTTGAGTITLNGTAKGSGAQSTYGIYFADTTGVISTVNGLLTLGGTNSSTSTTSGQVGIYTIAGSTVRTTGTGGITITATGGGSGVSANNYGAQFLGTIQATLAGGNSVFSLTGTGGDASGSGGNNYGVYLGGTVTGNGANATITGTGGNSSASGNTGIYVATSNLSNTGAGKVILIGNGAGSNSLEYGIDVAGTVTQSGQLQLTGTGGGASTSEHGISFDNGSIIGSGAAITLTGNASGTGTGSGIVFQGTSNTLSNTGAGTITLTGTAKGGGVGDQTFGILAQDTTTSNLTTVNGLLSLTGTNSSTLAADNQIGLYLGNNSTVKSTGTGGLTLAGTGGGGGISQFDRGVVINGTVIATLAAGNTPITITGTGGNVSGTSGYAYGVYLSGAITGNGANANITGTGGNSTGGYNAGVFLQKANLTNTGSGKIVVQGTGAGTGNNEYGVYLNDGPTNITSAELDITGTGAGTGLYEHGVRLNGGSIIGSNANISITGLASATGTGSGIMIDGAGDIIRTDGTAFLTLAGTAKGSGALANYGVSLNDSTGEIATQNGLLTITGTNTSTSTTNGQTGIYEASGAVIKTNGTGNLTMTGTGGGSGTGKYNYGIDIYGTIQGTLAGGNSVITLTGTGGNTATNSGYNAGVHIAGIISGNGTDATITGTGANAGFDNFGVELATATLANQGSGKIIIIGNGGAGNNVYNFGVKVDGTVTANAPLTITGTAGGTLYDEDGIGFENGHINGQGQAIDLTGTAAAASSGNGISFIGTSSITNTGNGTITLHGTAKGSGTSAAVDGISMADTAPTTISTVDGLISLTGTNTSTSTTNGQQGLYLGTQTILETTGIGGISLTGSGGGSGVAESNIGIALYGTVQGTLAGGNSVITITGNGGNASGTGASNYGALIAGTIAGNGIDATITGTGGTSSGANNYGVDLSGAHVSNTGTAKIIVQGTGGSNGSSAYGVNISGTNSTTGNLSITGTGAGTGLYSNGVVFNNGSLTGSGNTIDITGQVTNGSNGAGIYFGGSGETLSNTGSGTITLTGTGKGNGPVSFYGVYLGDATGTVSTADGMLTIIGTGSSSNVSHYQQIGVDIVSGTTIKTTGTGGISITGNGGGSSATSDNYGVDLGGTVIAALANGNSLITITGNGGSATTGQYNYGINLHGYVTGNGGDVTITGNGGSDVSNRNEGIHIAGATLANTGTGKTILLGNGGGTGNLEYGVNIAGAMNVSGLLDMTGLARGTSTTGIMFSGGSIVGLGDDMTITGKIASGSTGDGIMFAGTGESVSNTGNGAVTLIGTASGTPGTPTYGVRIYDATAVLSTQNGLLTITGTNLTTGTWEADGVATSAGSIIKTTGTGSIAVNGTGAATSGTSYGVYLSGKVQADLAGGNSPIVITGTSGNSSGANHIGVFANLATLIGNGGDISVTGTGAQGQGITSNGGTYSNTGTGKILLTGTGNGNTTYEYGVQLYGNTQVTGNISIVGTSNGTTSQEDGVIFNGGTFVNNGGNITVAGTTTTAGAGAGIRGQMGAVVSTTGAGNITFTGATQSTGSGQTVWGILLDDPTISAVDGTITLSGYNTSTNTGRQPGLEILSSGVVTVTGTGGIVLNGWGGQGSNNPGIAIAGTVNATQAGGNSPITITGYGGTAGTQNYGVSLAAGTISGNGGLILITGNGGGSGLNDDGIYATTGTLTNTNGNIHLVGLGSTGGSGSGINLSASRFTVSTTGNGTIALDGTAVGSNTATTYGVYNTGSIAAQNGAIVITGIGTGTGSYGIYNGDGTIGSNGSGSINLVAERMDATVPALHSTGLIGGASQTGDVTISADDVEFATNGIKTAGNIVIAPFTTGTTAGIGSGTGTLSLSDAELALFDWGADKYLTVGGNNTGAMAINSAYTFAKPVWFQTAAGSDISVGGTLASTAAGNAVVLASGRNFSGGNVSVTGGGRWLIYSFSPTRNVESGLTGTPVRVYNQTIATYGPASVTETGNALVYYVLTPGTITITATDVSRTYGGSTPVFTYTYTCSNSCTADQALAMGPTVTTTATPASDIGNYAINVGGAALNDMYSAYTINYTAGKYSIKPAELTVRADSLTKLSGNSDPALTYTSSGFITGEDSSLLTGSLGRAPGESAGVYNIGLGTLSAGPHYTITFVGGTLTIQSTTSKTGGNTDPSKTGDQVQPLSPTVPPTVPDGSQIIPPLPSDAGDHPANNSGSNTGSNTDNNTGGNTGNDTTEVDPTVLAKHPELSRACTPGTNNKLSCRKSLLEKLHIKVPGKDQEKSAPSLPKPPKQLRSDLPAAEHTAAIVPATVQSQARADKDKNYVIQIGSYTTMAEAQKALQKFEARTGSTYAGMLAVSKVNIDGKGTMYRLRLRSFAGKDAANSALIKISANGTHGFVMRDTI